MASEIKVDTVMNAGGDNDSGIDLSTNDQATIKLANSNKAVFLANNMHLIGGNVARVQLSSSGTGTTPNTGNNNVHIEGNDDTLVLNSAGNGTIKFQENGTERMRIDTSGRLLIGTTTTVIDTDQFLQVSASQACNFRATVSNADGGSVINLQRSGNTQGDFLRLFNSSGNETGQIRVDSGGTTQFENVSDYRLKENIKDWDVDASAKVKQIKIKTFDWKDQKAVTNGKGLVGVIAHELQEVYPHCVSGEKDGYGGDVDKDGNKKPMYQGVDYGKLTPLLTKALQEALARIETLEAKVTALESE